MEKLSKYPLRISSDVREQMQYYRALFSDYKSALELRIQADEFIFALNSSCLDGQYSPLDMYLTAVLHASYHDVTDYFLKNKQPLLFEKMKHEAERDEKFKKRVEQYRLSFPFILKESDPVLLSLRGLFIHIVIKNNSAITEKFDNLFSSSQFEEINQADERIISISSDKSGGLTIGDSAMSLFEFLTYPSRLFPHSLEKQIEYILKAWRDFLSEDIKALLIKAKDYIKEHNRPHFSGPGKAVFGLSLQEGEEHYTPDKEWMPNVVLLAKNTLVWLSQLSKKYSRPIKTLDQIPDEELDILASRGFTGLWLIGLWRRSMASKTIKQLCGNKDAESSAYSLYDYVISPSLGGESAIENLRSRLIKRGIRLASDMVPNHTGIDSPLVIEHPEYFISQNYKPFASYSYTGVDLSSSNDIEIKIEDHYYNKTDCAVTFMRRDKRTGEVRYIYHGNDGTSMPWNDTAQLDYLNENVRRTVIDIILHVAKTFPIIRFDAAMTLAARHIRRLWYPAVGHAGDIPGRADHTMSDEEFASCLGGEFWKRVVDTIQEKAPDTLLLAEAFWMMEGYFVRSLGFHRVYNSAFMNMLRDENNKEYRKGIKETLSYDPEIMWRYVNFLNNPDENPAIEGFGTGDKYFGCCTLLATLPGLPMFGHGQIEGYREKYGMEFTSPRMDEKENTDFIEEHKRLIFPLLKKRYCYSGVKDFEFFDVINDYSGTQENVYAYANGYGSDRVFVIYNNSYSRAEGRMKKGAKKNNLINGNRVISQSDFVSALKLESGKNKFMKYRTLSDSLYHIYPVSKIKREGYYVKLNGFETRVMENITTVTDTNGSYAKYFEVYGDKGAQNLEEEAEALLFEPIYRSTPLLAGKEYIASLNTLVTKDSYKALNTVINALLTSYSNMKQAIQNEGINIKMYDVDENDIKRVFKNISLLRRKTNKFIESADGVTGSLSSLIAVYFYVLPFIKQPNSVSDDFINFITRMSVKFYTFLFMKDSGDVDVNLTNAVKRYIKELITLSSFPLKADEVLRDEKFRALIDVNNYNGITWYNKSIYQEAVFFIAFSKVFTSAIEEYDVFKISDFCIQMQKIAENTEYKFEKLLNNSNILFGGK